MRPKWPAVLFMTLLWLGFVGVSTAQSTNSGDISGIVTDTTGAPIPGATVTVLNIATGVSKELLTNDAGVYDTSSIVVGTYKITFSKQGFGSLVRSSISLEVGNTNVNAQLSVGSVTQEVVVTTDIPLLKTENGEQSTTLSAETLQALPEVGQDWTQFAILLPGAAGAPGGSQGALAAAGSTAPGITVAVNGNLPYSTVLTDGAETTLPASANSDILTQETIQELQTVTSAFSAQYGVGGILYNQISKGGTNRFHGAAYEYFQNDALNAFNYNFGGKPTKYLRYDNFGGSIGGPILKDKLFFYFNYDHIISHGGTSATLYTIPTTAAMNGDFTGQATIYDPATQTTQATGTYLYPGQSVPSQCPCVIRQSFASEYNNGNKIPASRLDPVAAAIQKYYPASNAPGTLNSAGLLTNNYTYTSPSSNPFIRYFGRLDWQVKSNNRITISESEGDNPGFSFGAGVCPIGCQTNDVSKQNAQISDVWIISPRFTNEARMGYTNQFNFFVPQTLGLGYPAKIGWQFAKVNNFPSINITNYGGVLNSAINAVYKEHVYDPSDVVTLVTGKHILHFGGEFLIYQNNSTSWGNLNAGTMGYTGTYTSEGVATGLSNSATGLSYADFLLGQTQNWGAAETPEYGGRMKLPQLFVQDDWKLRPNLTLNLGLRYQIQTGWSEVKGNEASFDPTVQNTATGTLGAMWYGSTKANGRGRIQNGVYDTFLPRLGFAYQLDPNTVIRGGFGLYAYNWSNDTYNGGVMGGAFGSKGSVTDTTNGITPVVLLSGSGTNLNYISATTSPTGYNGQNVNYVQYHQPVGGSYQWNFQLQRQINPNMVASLAYVASHGHDLPFPVDLNQVPQSKLAPNDQQSRPFPQFGNISVTGTAPGLNAISNYNSLQAVIQERLSHGLSFNFSYVWSHFLDDMDSSGWGSRAGNQFWQNAYNPAANYGNSNFDVRNAFKGNALYQLPFGTGKQFLNNNRLLDAIVGGWQLSGLLIVQSGQPFTPNMSSGTNAYSLAGNNFKWYPNVIGNPQLSGRGIHQWFNEAAFAVPANGTFGNMRRNQLNGPDLSTVNLSLGKTFNIWESVNLQIRADADNAFNHASFGLPATGLQVNSSGTISTGTSQITSTTVPGRTMQLTARITF
jgi:Carboxypeptidase regulatory-like domain/TonB dependent receptor